MGGFAVDVSDIHDTLSVVSLSIPGILYLARRGIYLEASDKDIVDKSKADSLAKGLVLLQVLWMILQCISRAAVGYPLAVLEIHTLVHAGCALVMYSLWWSKPLDIRVPTLIPAAGFMDEIALMLIRNTNGSLRTIDPGKKAFRMYTGSDDRESEASILLLNQPESQQPLPTVRPESTQSDVNEELTSTLTKRPSWRLTDRRSCDDSRGTNVRILRDECSEMGEATNSLIKVVSKPPSDVDIACTLVTGEFLTCGIGPGAVFTGELRRAGAYTMLLKFFGRKSPQPKEDPQLVKSGLHKFGPPRDYTLAHKIAIQLSHKDIHRWELASKARTREMFESNIANESRKYLQLGVSTTQDVENGSYLLCSRCSNIGANPYSFTALLFSSWNSGWKSWFQALLTSGSLVLLGAFYGGVHLALWDYRFPTEVEKLLWRISAVTLAALPCGIALGAILILPWRAILEFSKDSPKFRDLRGKVHTWMEPLRRLFALPQDVHDFTWWHWLLQSPIILLGVFLPLLQLAVELSTVLAALVMAAAILLYGFSRVFLIVESFISMRHVPVGVYDDVSWARYIPHF